MSELLRKSFDEGGWSLDYLVNASGKLPIGGIILKNVKHWQYNLAKDIRITGICINDNRLLALGDDDLELFGNLEILHQEEIIQQQIKAGNKFDGYQIVAGLRQNYATKNPILEETDVKLLITQTYLFSTYDLNPAHEPGGVLQAARVFPLIRFEFFNESNSDKLKIEKIRIDYRLHFSLDILLFPPEHIKDPALFDKIIPKNEKVKINSLRPNQAGIFRDNKTLPSPFALLYKSHKLGSEAIKQIFYAGEKPLQYEVCSIGLKKGKCVEDDGSFMTWDNIHLWAGYQNYKKLPSTPGAFHAAHLHWRWAKVVQTPKESDKADLPQGGKIQFEGILGGALLDPKIPKQTIRFAITKSNSDDNNIDSTDQLNANHKRSENERKFDDLFKKNKEKPPKSIKDGEDIVTWISFEANREYFKIPFTGTVFIHGLYFAHNLELQNFATWVTQGESLPGKDVSQKWDRYASEKDYH